MSTTTFTTVILGMGNNAGIEVPETALAELGTSKRPPVVVTVGTYTYRSTVGSMAGKSLIPLAKAHREASGLSAGDEVTVTLVLEQGERPVEVPTELVDALAAAGVAAAFEARPYSARKEFSRQVATAKATETKDRRIAKIIESLR